MFLTSDLDFDFLSKRSGINDFLPKRSGVTKTLMRNILVFSIKLYAGAHVTCLSYNVILNLKFIIPVDSIKAQLLCHLVDLFILVCGTHYMSVNGTGNYMPKHEFSSQEVDYLVFLF